MQLAHLQVLGSHAVDFDHYFASMCNGSRNCLPQGRATVTRTLGCRGLGRAQGSGWGGGARKPTESSKRSYSQDKAKWFKKEKQSEIPKQTVAQTEHMVTHHLDVPGRPFRGLIAHCLPASNF